MLDDIGCSPRSVNESRRSHLQAINQYSYKASLDFRINI